VNVNTSLDSVQRASQEQYSRRSHRYAPGQGHVLEQVEDVQAAMQFIPLPPGARVLDVAAGAGNTGLFLASLGHRVTLSDLTEAMLDRAREAAAKRDLAVEFRQHPAEAMPYADASFDLVTCRVAAHHFSAPEKFVAEVARVLVDGGHFLLVDNSVEDDQPVAEEWIHQVEKLRDPSHHRLLTPRTWRRLCEKHGLTVRHSEVHPFKQPDIDWYFDTAGTPSENRQEVLKLTASAPEAARRLFRLGIEDGKIVWWWQRLTLIAWKEVHA
jgi:ubiquinone/menaquinone biosynthesis C-methylase UbiE